VGCLRRSTRRPFCSGLDGTINLPPWPGSARAPARTLTPEYIGVVSEVTGVPFAVAIHLPVNAKLGHAAGRSQPCSLQLRVLRFGFLQDGDVGIGVFPEREEILIGGTAPC
jgi:hypothetical protein